MKISFTDSQFIPFGIKNGTLQSFSYSFTYPISSYYNDIIMVARDSITYSTNVTDKYPSDSGLTTDNIAPTLQSVNFYPLGSSFYTMALQITDDLSGFLKFKFGEIDFTQNDLVYGTINNGRYEKILYLATFQSISFGFISDMAGNENSYQITFPYYISDFSINSIASVSFLYNDIDTTYLESPFKNKLFLNFTHSNKQDFGVSLVLDGINSDNSYFNPKSVKYIGYWDAANDLFTIDFEIPPRTYSSKELPFTLYINGFSITSESLSNLLSEGSKLRISSDYADQMPPVISNIQYYPSDSSLIIVPKEGLEISFIVSIDDEYNGLKNGTLKITSNLDPFGHEFIIKPEVSDNYNMYFGIYQLKFNISGNCRDQSFNITEATLFDTSNYKSSITESTYLNPLYLLGSQQNQLKVQCSNSIQVESDTPKLVIFELDTSSINLSGSESERTVIITFSTTDTGSGISLSHLPSIYIVDASFQRYEFKSIFISYSNLIANYECKIIIPVSFGLTGFIYFSIYGIVDNHLNFAGYSSEDLRFNQFDYYISTTNSFSPIITSASPFYLQVDSVLTVFGKGFSGDSTFQIDRLNGVGFANTSKLDEEGTYIYRKLNISSFNITEPFNIRVFLSSNLISNSYLVAPIPFKEPLKCPGIPVCGGNSKGHCVEGSCICIPPYVGEDCSTKTIISEPGFNNQIPSISNLVENTETQVTLICLREINIYGQVVNEYSLLEDRNWGLQVINEATFEFLYYSNFTNPKDNNSNTQFNVSIQYFPTAKNITWAGHRIQLYPSSTKYNFKISQYNFQNQLNYLQIVMAAYIKTNETESCSSQSNSKGNNEDFYKLNINDIAFLLRFNKIGILDGKITKITTSSIASSEISNYNITKYYPNSNDTFITANIISMNIPKYSKFCQVDPDFSSIIDTRTSNDNYLCSKNGSLKGSKLVGIIIGSIVGGLVFILAISYILFVKFKYSSISIGIIKLVKLNK